MYGTTRYSHKSQYDTHYSYDVYYRDRGYSLRAWQVSAGATSVALGCLMIIAWMIMWVLLVPVIVLCAAAAFGLLKLKPSETRIRQTYVHAKLQDGAKAVLTRAWKMSKAAGMAPEGSMIKERSNEFTRLTYELLSAMQDLNESISDGTMGSYHEALMELNGKAERLASAGSDLSNIVLHQRLQNVMSEVGHLGIDQFIEEASLETAAFRALETGDG